GILAFLKIRTRVFANLTYLDSLNRYIVLYFYKALTVKGWFLLSRTDHKVALFYLRIISVENPKGKYEEHRRRSQNERSVA
ncbi:MAG: hypothetical protein WA667_16925, partial [Candidatus Nitrosopolaris sp.]